MGYNISKSVGLHALHVYCPKGREPFPLQMNTNPHSEEQNVPTNNEALIDLSPLVTHPMAQGLTVPMTPSSRRQVWGMYGVK